MSDLALMQIRAVGLPEPEKEYRFHDVRKWRFDLAWPDRKIALEVEGGAYISGRHTRGKGYEGDCEKYSMAAILGWCVVRATTGQVKSGLALRLVELAHKSRENE
jgi:uncharacterized protein (UPF0128 family)